MKLQPYQQTVINRFGQQIGLPLNDDIKQISPAVLTGQYISLIPFDTEHLDALWQAIQNEPDDSCWTYLPYGPFLKPANLQQWWAELQQVPQQQLYAIIDQNLCVGFCALLNIRTADAAVEIGHVYFSSEMRRSQKATEAIFLLLKQVFQHGFRRCEWKCNALNQGSKKAALRFGFQYEGLFRHDRIVKGHNRNTAWFSMLDDEWPTMQQAFINWLDRQNFDQHGRQRQTLSDCLIKP